MTFKEISAAYDVLGDADRRKEYDEVRAMGPAAAGAGFPGGFGGGTFRVDDMGDLGDLFGGLFGRGRRGGGGPGPQRGADVETELHLSFEDAVKGVTTSVNLTTDVRCHTCRGTGPPPAPSRRPVRGAGARAPSRTTRASSRSARSARSAGDGARWWPPRARPARGPGSNTATGRSRCASRPGWKTGSASGSRAAAPRGGTAARAVTCTWSSAWTAMGCSAVGAGT